MMRIHTVLPLVLLCASPGAAAMNYPVRPVRIIVPAPPGGSTDRIGRLVGAKLTDISPGTSRNGPGS